MKKQITIIGSGINSYFFIKTILSKGYKVNLIDIDTDKLSNKKKEINYKLNISPKVTLENFEEKISIYKNYNKFIYNNFNNQSAISIGGLSNIWGGTVYKFNEDELIKNKMNKFELYKYLKYLDYKNIYLKKQSYDSYFEKNINQEQYQINYNNLLLLNNNKPLNVTESIKNYINQKKIKFISGFVENITKDGDSYKLSIRSKDKIHTFVDKKIVLAAGSLSSAKLIMQLLNIDSTRLLCTPSEQSVFLSSRKQLDTSLNSILTFHRKNKNEIVSNIFPLNGLDNKFFFDYMGVNIKLANPLLNILKQYLYGIYTYYSSDYSKIKINKVNENYYINGSNLNKNIYKLNNFYNKKMIRIPFSNKILLQGNDNHIGGSFPLETYFNEFNEMKNFKNLFVIDGSYLNYIPPLGYTLITILNSIRIADKLSNEY